uniref:Putative double LAGLIDADG homing endonuclease n=1 Tax=Staurocarteria crucifera TaxID=47781 RepID=A0A0S2IC61_9CHLO|nr:putative double LAGLIDADG homing endonuclease [Carteria crucifera]
MGHIKLHYLLEQPVRNNCYDNTSWHNYCWRTDRYAIVGIFFVLKFRQAPPRAAYPLRRTCIWGESAGVCAYALHMDQHKGKLVKKINKVGYISWSPGKDWIKSLFLLIQTSCINVGHAVLISVVQLCSFNFPWDNLLGRANQQETKEQFACFVPSERASLCPCPLAFVFTLLVKNQRALPVTGSATRSYQETWFLVWLGMAFLLFSSSLPMPMLRISIRAGEKVFWLRHSSPERRTAGASRKPSHQSTNQAYREQTTGKCVQMGSSETTREAFWRHFDSVFMYITQQAHFTYARLCQGRMGYKVVVLWVILKDLWAHVLTDPGYAARRVHFFVLRFVLWWLSGLREAPAVLLSGLLVSWQMHMRSISISLLEGQSTGHGFSPKEKSRASPFSLSPFSLKEEEKQEQEKRRKVATPSGKKSTCQTRSPLRFNLIRWFGGGNNSIYDFSAYDRVKCKHKKHFSPDFLEWFIGFSEGDGSFYIKDKKPVFTINQADLPLLKKIRTELGFGVVSTYVQGDATYARYTVQGVENIERLIAIFNGNIHLNKVYKRFAAWVAVFDKQNQKQTVLKPRKPATEINLESHWLSGFWDAEGGFSAYFSSAKRAAAGTRLNLKAYVDQKAELEVFEHICKLFEVPKLTFRNPLKQYYRVEISSKQSLPIVLSYFETHKLRGKKGECYAVWKRLANLYLKNLHLAELNNNFDSFSKRVDKVKELNALFKKDKSVLAQVREITEQNADEMKI